MSTPYDKIAYFYNTPLDKLTDDEIDFAIDYFGDFDGWMFKMEKRRRQMIDEFTEMIYHQPLTTEDYDFIEKMLRQTFEELKMK